MNPKTYIHRDIEIRYGYDIREDGYRANFTLPAERQAPVKLQRVVTTGLQQAIHPAGLGHVLGSSEAEVLERAKAAIDRFLGE